MHFFELPIIGSGLIPGIYSRTPVTLTLHDYVLCEQSIML